ncbi:hypothetical protein [Flavisolibacter nicotianae]|uniref:hypothetical protein n=1 Tax=Flavisolibacter nicotianae TaxID=2364882 RepID=UPI000EAD950E|nr:hypothetical protein [Flavisolibacter nicotianae]
MERILLIVNAHHPDVPSIEFAARIASLERTGLTAILFESTHYEPVLMEQPEVFQYFTNVVQTGEAVLVRANTDRTVNLIEEECRFAGVELDLVIDQGNPVVKTLSESRFADFIIIDPEFRLSPGHEGAPSQMVREILLHSECPVLLSPKEFAGVNEVVFCYDDSASSVFAIKQFTLLFPVFKNSRAVLLQVHAEGENEKGTDGQKRMMAWLNMHYSSVTRQVLKGNAKEKLFTYFFLQTKKIVILGAYGRGIVSNLFRKSHADALIRMVDLPLFIAHH